jgi:hypothetical protein
LVKARWLDEYTVHLIILIILAGVLILLERIFTKSLEGFFYALLPTLLLVLFYILLHRRSKNLEDYIKELLETHIPDVVYIDDPEVIKTEFINAVNKAEKYIMTTGGKSRIKEYLSAIEKNLEGKGIEYYRIVFGLKISTELYEHLSKIVGNQTVYISYNSQEFAPTLLLTEKVVFLGLPEPKPDEFKTCLKIPDEKIIYKLGKYIRIWHEKSEKVSSKEDLKKVQRD